MAEAWPTEPNAKCWGCGTPVGRDHIFCSVACWERTRGRITTEEAQERSEPVLKAEDYYDLVECPGCGAQKTLWTRGLEAHTCESCGVRFSGDQWRAYIIGPSDAATSSPGSAKGHRLVRLPEGMSYEPEEQETMRKGDPEGPTAKEQRERRFATQPQPVIVPNASTGEPPRATPSMPIPGGDITHASAYFYAASIEEVDALKARIEEVRLNGEILAERLDQRDVLKLKLAQRIEALERGAKAQGQGLLSFLRRLEVVERTTGDDYLQSDVSTLDARLEAGDRAVDEETVAERVQMDADCERMARREELLAVAREVLVALIESGVVDKGRCPREAVRLALDLVRAVEEAA